MSVNPCYYNYSTPMMSSKLYNVPQQASLQLHPNYSQANLFPISTYPSVPASPNFFHHDINNSSLLPSNYPLPYVQSSKPSHYAVPHSYPVPMPAQQVSIPTISPSSYGIENQLTNFIMNWKAQTNFQTDLLRTQLLRLSELHTSLNFKLMLDRPSGSPPSRTVQDMSPDNYSSIAGSYRDRSDNFPLLCNTKKTLKSQIREMVVFMLENFGRISEMNMEREKARYEDNEELSAVFEALFSKYSSTIKTKEEMVKYTLRKAFKSIKNNIKKETNVDSKEAWSVVCKKYFVDYSDKVEECENDDDFLKIMLPFRKTSRNKTMNSTFIKEVFSSEGFCKDFERYLEDLEEILETDNNAKVERFSSFLVDCVKHKKLYEVKKYKRVPWPQLWITSTKKIACDLLGAEMDNGDSQLFKCVKTENSF